MSSERSVEIKISIRKGSSWYEFFEKDGKYSISSVNWEEPMNETVLIEAIEKAKEAL